MRRNTDAAQGEHVEGPVPPAAHAARLLEAARGDEGAVISRPARRGASREAVYSGGFFVLFFLHFSSPGFILLLE